MVIYQKDSALETASQELWCRHSIDERAQPVLSHKDESKPREYSPKFGR